MVQALGNDVHLYEASGEGSGHVTRNVRLTLSLIDLVEVSGFRCFLPQTTCRN